jgi:peptidyl-tRNA hydrolase, PTH1 family
MDGSGPWVYKLWHDMLEQEKLGPTELGLVVLHHQLEEELGGIKLSFWDSPHRNNVGVKSVAAELRKHSFPGAQWWRIAVGIGRPANRSHRFVEEYLKRYMTEHERDILEQTGPKLLKGLRSIPWNVKKTQK